METQFVIIGGGIAGTTAAEEIRKADAKARITIIEQEFNPLYSRVLLPHYIKERVARERVFLKTPEWYQEQNIDLMQGVIARGIDTTNKFVATSDEREIPYDKLLITTGGQVRTLPEHQRGVTYLQSIDDADTIVQLLAEMKSVPEEMRHGLVYGGGFIALEFINIFRHFQIPCTVIKRGDGFWSRMLNAHAKQVLADHAIAQDVTIATGVAKIEIEGERELSGVRTDDGRSFAGQMLGVGIGIERSLERCSDAGIEIDQGVLANEYLETNVEDVYTAGDVAQYVDTAIGRRITAGNWMNALMQGRTVAKTMLGERTPFSLVSSYSTNLLGKEIVFIGDVDREAADACTVILEEKEHSIETFERHGRTVGAILIGKTTDRQAITNAIKQQERYA